MNDIAATANGGLGVNGRVGAVVRTSDNLE